REATAGHVTGMQSAAMYTVGCTATIFGCLQVHRGGKTQTRLTTLPTPDAYNDLVLWDDDAEEYRKLIDPSKPKKRVGDVKMIEAAINPIEFTDMGQPANRNAYLRKWMVNKGKGRMENGEFIPSDDNPIGKPKGPHGSFTIKQEWWFYKEGENPPATHVPWIAEMCNDLLMQKANQTLTKRVHNSWKRTKGMFELLLGELQGQRVQLKRCRRGAQGLIITNETRYVNTKDRLIADFYKHADERLMKDVCFYNYAGEKLSLQFRPDPELEELIAHILDHTDSHVDELREYLKADPTMHHARTNESGNPDTKLCNKWLMQHYIAPIRDILSEYVQREPPDPERAKAHAAKVAECRKNQRPEPPPLRNKIKIVEETKDVVDPETGEVLPDKLHLRRIDFHISNSAPQPRYMATLFMLIDAHRFKYDAEGMLPTPFIGMTKTAGGRAQRYMDHGHRSRIQAMCHTFDIFPNKKLGIAMADALQEAQRLMGYDEMERFNEHYAKAHPRMWGEHMDNWVDQVYISTRDFIPLIQNALQSQLEWARMLAKERLDPQRTDPATNFTTHQPETDEEY
ncbi:MAG: hypothetical protein ACPG9N_04670, partial [Miltoncostaeaceae bacterium]